MAEHAAVQITAFNAADPVAAASLGKRAARDPGLGEVQVQLKLAGVNPSDVFSLMGVYPGFPKPGVPGFDGMGVVTKIGAGVSGFSEGQRVTSLGWLADQGEGSWQASITLPADRLVALPDAVSDEAGAQFYINPLTVVGLLEVAAVKPGEHLIITAAGSTLSRMLIAAAKADGIKTIGVVRRPEAVAELKSSTGVDEVICSTTEKLSERVKAITAGAGAASALDSVGGTLMAELAAAVRPGASVWLYGLMEGLTFTGSGVDLLFRDVVYRGFWFSTWLNSKPPAERQATIDRTIRLMAEGLLVPPIGKVFPLSQWADAVGESQAVGRLGKVLLKCS